MAGRDIQLQAADIDAASAVELRAGRDIDLQAGRQKRETEQGFHHCSKSLLGGSSNTYRGSTSADEAQSSSGIGGRTIAVQAGSQIAYNAVENNLLLDRRVRDKPTQ